MKTYKKVSQELQSYPVEVRVVLLIWVLLGLMKDCLDHIVTILIEHYFLEDGDMLR